VLVIDRLGDPVAAPVAVGSSPSPETMSSDARDVVEVAPDGSLVGIRAGAATVRAAGTGQALHVTVRPVSAVVLAPSTLALRTGERRDLVLLAAEDGKPLPPGSIQWFTDAPGVALVREGRVEAGESAGTATVTALYGGARAQARVRVESLGGPPFEVVPRRATLRVGEVVTFSARSAAGPVLATWRGGVESVLGQSGPSTFVGHAPGKSEVCGSWHQRTVCSVVRVRR
jgi:hypothetical protein